MFRHRRHVAGWPANFARIGCSGYNEPFRDRDLRR
jgi:hypothetical protein